LLVVSVEVIFRAGVAVSDAMRNAELHGAGDFMEVGRAIASSQHHSLFIARSVEGAVSWDACGIEKSRVACCGACIYGIADRAILHEKSGIAPNGTRSQGGCRCRLAMAYRSNHCRSGRGKILSSARLAWPREAVLNLQQCRIATPQ